MFFQVLLLNYPLYTEEHSSVFAGTLGLEPRPKILEIPMLPLHHAPVSMIYFLQLFQRTLFKYTNYELTFQIFLQLFFIFFFLSSSVSTVLLLPTCHLPHLTHLYATILWIMFSFVFKNRAIFNASCSVSKDFFSSSTPFGPIL